MDIQALYLNIKRLHEEASDIERDCEYRRSGYVSYDNVLGTWEVLPTVLGMINERKERARKLEAVLTDLVNKLGRTKAYVELSLRCGLSTSDAEKFIDDLLNN